MRKNVFGQLLACALILLPLAALADGLHEQLDEELSGGTSLFQQKQQLTVQQKKLAD